MLISLYEQVELVQSCTPQNSRLDLKQSPPATPKADSPRGQNQNEEQTTIWPEELGRPGTDVHDVIERLSVLSISFSQHYDYFVVGTSHGCYVYILNPLQQIDRLGTLLR